MGGWVTQPTPYGERLTTRRRNGQIEKTSQRRQRASLQKVPLTGSNPQTRTKTQIEHPSTMSPASNTSKEAPTALVAAAATASRRVPLPPHPEPRGEGLPGQAAFAAAAPAAPQPITATLRRWPPSPLPQTPAPPRLRSVPGTSTDPCAAWFPPPPPSPLATCSQVHAPTLPPVDTVPTPPTHTSLLCPPAPTAAPRPRRRPTVPFPSDGATRASPTGGPFPASPARNLHPTRTPRRAASPRALPRDMRRSISSDGPCAQHPPCPPSTPPP